MLLRQINEAPIFKMQITCPWSKEEVWIPCCKITGWRFIRLSLLGFLLPMFLFAFSFFPVYIVRTLSHGWEASYNWVLFFLGILGTGIFLWAAYWAYEALTFGGYWAWDQCWECHLWSLDCIDWWHHLHHHQKGEDSPNYCTYSTYLHLFLILYSTYLTLKWDSWRYFGACIYKHGIRKPVNRIMSVFLIFWAVWWIKDLSPLTNKRKSQYILVNFGCISVHWSFYWVLHWLL